MNLVALFTRAWIEIVLVSKYAASFAVALFTRAWIEIEPLSKYTDFGTRRPLHEGVD